ncbi:MAG: VOC family protein [Arcanobacterium sp.]|nr:VOC family protein [Arcanobacterium sp.]
MSETFNAPVPCIWINGSASEAAQYYAEIFRDVQISDQGMTCEVTIHGQKFILLGVDDHYQPNPSISGLLRFNPQRLGGEAAAREYLSACNAALSEGGSLMELGSYPFSDYYAWVRDRYGFTWQLMLAPELDNEAVELIPAFMFGGTNHGNCENATDYWMQHLGGEVKHRLRYEADDFLEEGTIAFSTISLGSDNKEFAAMDSGAFHDFTFTPGISLVLFAETQNGINQLWDALSAQPDQERCGWCVDSWGVSWQVLPRNIGELMAVEETRTKLMQMGKIELAEFEK